MKTIAKIDPEKEYELAKELIELASKQMLDASQAGSLDTSVTNLMHAARILMEREEKRRGHPKPPPKELTPKGRQKGESREETKKLPSIKYPELEIEEDIITPIEVPTCPCCNGKMKESGLFDVSEKLEMIPKRYYVRRIKRTKYNCPHCYGSMASSPVVPSIVPQSNYGDSVIVDVALSKYSNLIPVERYSQMAFENGLGGDLPPQTLIGLTHHLANFLGDVVQKIKKEVLDSLLLLADETPHKMLEGDATKNWYLWGFFCSKACYFEAHNTRSGNVVTNFLRSSQAKFLLSDGYAGYGKAIKDIKTELNRVITESFCNAHAYRYFEEASVTWKEECQIFLEIYGKIYDLERERKKLEGKISKDEELEFRTKMTPLFENLKQRCFARQTDIMASSSLEKAINYFLNHYDGLTLCAQNLLIPLDNNFSERQLRSPVIGRKTWFGTHSKRGALTAAAMFTVIQTCKINGINPRNYLIWVIERIHHEYEILTPYEYAKILSGAG